MNQQKNNDVECLYKDGYISILRCASCKKLTTCEKLNTAKAGTGMSFFTKAVLVSPYAEQHPVSN